MGEDRRRREIQCQEQTHRDQGGEPILGPPLTDSEPRQLLESTCSEQKKGREDLEVVSRAEAVQSVAAGREMGNHHGDHDGGQQPVGRSGSAQHEGQKRECEDEGQSRRTVHDIPPPTEDGAATGNDQRVEVLKAEWEIGCGVHLFPDQAVGEGDRAAGDEVVGDQGRRRGDEHARPGADETNACRGTIAADQKIEQKHPGERNDECNRGQRPDAEGETCGDAGERGNLPSAATA